ncbi:MAG: flagellar hook-associated protein FlgK [Lachnospiraceae bacterium]|nr:flagellar hook-associated protein FlgK [Lachnospiraceae bacterium]
MSSQFFGLNVAYTGLNAYMASINTTANNISNVQTKGYSKQVVELESQSAIRAFDRYGNVGAGVSAKQVSQLRDLYYDTKYWNNESYKGYYSTKEYYMLQIENYYTDDATTPGFSSVFASMFNSLDAVKSNAGSTSVRNQFISDASKLCSYFNTNASRLELLQATVNDEVKTTVNNINSIAQKVALLNKQINTIEQNGGQANELRDQRALLVDELSGIVTIEAKEAEVTNSNYPDMYTGATTYTIKVNGQVLVDTYEYNTLKTVTRTNKYNQSDIDGLYDVVWEATDVKFDVWGNNQRGSLRGLFEIRDGNDRQNLKGQVSETGTNTLKITNPSITNAMELNLPPTGTIMVNNTYYNYSSFDVEMDADENITSVTFNFDTGFSDTVQTKLAAQNLVVGSTVDYKGIPYYMNQMNLFLRNFSRVTNDLHKQGIDMNGDDGTSFFVANDVNMNREGDFDGYYLDGTTADDLSGITDATGTITFRDSSDTYYRLTAANVMVASAISAHPEKMATTKKRYDDDNNVINDGVDSATLVKDWLTLEKDVKVFRDGGANTFLQCIYADVTVDTQECSTFTENFTNIEETIQNQRDSVSGVDEDEEALDLVKFQNAYNLSSKMISVLAEIYDQLILRTGV